MTDTQPGAEATPTIERPDGAGEWEAIQAANEAELESAIEKMEAKLGTPEDDDAPRRAKPKNGKAALEDADDDDAELDEDADEDLEAADDDEEDEDEPTAASGADDGDEDGDEAETDKDDEDMALHRAYTKLHDAGVPSAVLKRTPRKELIAWANRVEEGKAAPGAGPSSTDGGREPQQDSAKAAGTLPTGDKPATDWAAVRSGIAKDIGIDEEYGKAFSPLTDALENLERRLDASLEQNQRFRDELLARDGRATIDSNLKRLERNGYQGLRADEAKKEKLIEHAAALLKAGVAKTADDAFSKAARAELGKPRKATAFARRNGMSDPPTRRGGPMREVANEDDYFSAALDIAYSDRDSKHKQDLISRLGYPSRPKAGQ